MLSKKCLVCRRQFPSDHTQCFQCLLPLWDTAENQHVQAIELGSIIRILIQRYENAVRDLRGARDYGKILRPEPQKHQGIRRLARLLEV